MDTTAFNPDTKQHEAYRAGKLIGAFSTGREAMRALMKAGSEERKIIMGEFGMKRVLEIIVELDDEIACQSWTREEAEAIALKLAEVYFRQWRIRK